MASGDFNRIAFVLAALLAGGVCAAQPGSQANLSQRSLEIALSTLHSLSEYRALRSANVDGKCGFGFSVRVNEALRGSTDPAKTAFRTMTRTVSERDTAIGRFRIHFDTTAATSPAMLDGSGNRIANSWRAYVDSVGRIFNDVWNTEVGQMGYAAPPITPGDSLYDLYVVETGGSYYGSTDLLGQISEGTNPGLFYSEIELDNDFREFYTKGIAALRVTAAHEFHHSIQVGACGYWSDQIFFHELTSVSMEEIVYPDVNDYFQYLQEYFEVFRFGTVPQTFVTADHPAGYERCIWGLYLQKKFGPGLMRDAWEADATLRFLPAFASVFHQHATTFEQEYFSFTAWTYHTADRADLVRSFTEGDHYPRLKPMESSALPASSGTIYDQMPPVASGLYQFVRGSDTIAALLTNVDADAANRGDQSYRTFAIEVGPDVKGGAIQQLSNGLAASLHVADPSRWRIAYFSATSNASIQAQLLPSPNPYKISSGQNLLLPVAGGGTDPVEISFVSLAGDVKFARRYALEDLAGESVVSIPSQDIRSSVGSGVYLIVAHSSAKEFVWKLAVVQ